MAFSSDIKNKIKPEYSSNLVEEFYRPLLREADLYQRVSGYFSTSGLDLYSESLEELAKNGGSLEFIISKEISKEDYDRIKAGYDLLEEIKPLNLAQRNERLTSKTQQQLGNLAFMIAMGRARIKIALTNKGLFHDKFGIITSGSEKVFFNGSANETENGMQINYESISVDTSWDSSENVQYRINSNQERFERLWNDKEDGVKVVEVSDIAYEEIAKYQSQSNIKEIIKIDDQDSKLAQYDNAILFKYLNDTVIRIDSTDIKLSLNDRKLKPGSDLSRFFEEDYSTIKKSTTYRDIERIIKVTEERAERKNIEVIVSKAVSEYLQQYKYSIEKYKILGDVFKGELVDFPTDKKDFYKEFSKVVQSEVSRPLYEIHLRSAYFMYEMARAANFSVPGAGKTAMLLGVFAYLNRENAPFNEKIDRLLVVSPLNAFDSWKREFKAVFGDKKVLRSIDSQTSSDFGYDLSVNWGVSNLVLVNYESLPKYLSKLNENIDTNTMLVFDEVHRVKNPEGTRAGKALELSKKPKFKYVLTGTPIPNTYQDIYNFLHILYGNEYNSYFGWDLGYLYDPKIRQIKDINSKLYPFFWRTNKKDLNVPVAEEDYIEIVGASPEQLALAELIYSNEESSLAKLIRLIQASTNPALVNRKINYNELMSYDDDGDIHTITEKEFNSLLYKNGKKNSENLYSDLDLENMRSPKFDKGIELVEKLVKEGKKVLVWGIFVDTLYKITNTIKEKGIKVNLVYGGTNKLERTMLIDEFRDGDVQVLVSNPQTLGESISLHQTVHDAVYFEYNFNLTFMLQSRDRIHRLGLKENQYTRYYYLQTASEYLDSYRPGYIDEKIYDRLKYKERLMYEAIDDKTLSIEYSENEILDAIKIIDEERQRMNRNHE
ncbi:SNF2-related protein [Peptoniphilus sp. HMSC062D09]|uniref:SNF2-related protein n=1 Tax=Peptoniphilus TaxID=162289 RepID=UPI0008A2728E|nr:SNF2-related protein [Peptoniphilus sp. HMSC062D09]OFK80062.1 helicase SNF2 [Peptoniphilus sp. HMSC062D09]